MTVPPPSLHTRDVIAELENELRQARDYKIAVLEQELHTRDSELKEVQLKYQQLQDDFNYNLQLLEQRDAELGNYDTQFASITDVRLEHEHQVHQLQSTVADTESRLKQETSKLLEAEAYIVKLQDESQRQQQSQQREIDYQLRQQRDRFEQAKIEWQRQMAEKDVEIDRVRTDVLDQQRVGESRYEEQLQQYQHTVEEQALDIKALRDELVDLQSLLQSKDDEYASLSEQFHQLQREYETTSQQHSNSTEKATIVLDEYEHRLADTVQQLKHLEEIFQLEKQHSTAAQQRHDESQQQFNALLAEERSQKQQLEQQLAKLKDSKEQEVDQLEEQLAAERSEHEHDVQQLQHQVADREHERQLLADKLENQTQTADTRQTELATMRNKLKEAEKKLDDALRSASEQRFDYERLVDSRDAHIAELKQNAIELQQAIDSLASDRDNVDATHVVLTKRLADYQQQLASTRAELLTLRHDFNLLSQQRYRHTAAASPAAAEPAIQLPVAAAPIAQSARNARQSVISAPTLTVPAATPPQPHNVAPPTPPAIALSQPAALTPVVEEPRISIISPPQSPSARTRAEEENEAVVSLSFPADNNVDSLPGTTLHIATSSSYLGLPEQKSPKAKGHRRRNSSKVHVAHATTHQSTFTTTMNSRTRHSPQPSFHEEDFKHIDLEADDDGVTMEEAVVEFPAQSPVHHHQHSSIESMFADSRAHDALRAPVDDGGDNAEPTDYASFNPLARPSHHRRGSVQPMPEAVPVAFSQPDTGRVAGFTPHLTERTADEVVFATPAVKRSSGGALFKPNSRRGTMNLEAVLVENEQLRDRIATNAANAMIPEGLAEMGTIREGHSRNESNTNSNDGMMLQEYEMQMDDNVESAVVQLPPSQPPTTGNTPRQPPQQQRFGVQQPAKAPTSRPPLPPAQRTTVAVQPRPDDAQYNTLIADNERLRQQNAAVQRVISEMKTEMMALLQQMAAQETQKDGAATGRVSALQQQIDHQTAINQDLSYRLQKMQQHNDLLVQKVDRLTDELNATAAAATATIQQQHAVSSSPIAAAAAVAIPMLDDSESKFLRQYVNEVHATVTSTRNELAALQREAEAEYEQYKQHIAEINIHQQKLRNQLRRRDEKQQVQQTAILQMERKHAELEQVSTARQREVTQLQQALNRLKAEREQLIDISNQLRADLSSAMNQSSDFSGMSPAGPSRRHVSVFESKSRSDKYNNYQDEKRAEADRVEYVPHQQSPVVVRVRSSEHDRASQQAARPLLVREVSSPLDYSSSRAEVPSRQSGSRKRQSVRQAPAAVDTADAFKSMHVQSRPITQQPQPVGGAQDDSQQRPAIRRMSERVTAGQADVLAKLKAKSAENASNRAIGGISQQDRLKALAKLKQHIQQASAGNSMR